MQYLREARSNCKLKAYRVRSRYLVLNKKPSQIFLVLKHLLCSWIFSLGRTQWESLTVLHTASTGMASWRLESSAGLLTLMSGGWYWEATNSWDWNSRMLEVISSPWALWAVAADSFLINFCSALQNLSIYIHSLVFRKSLKGDPLQVSDALSPWSSLLAHILPCKFQPP